MTLTLFIQNRSKPVLGFKVIYILCICKQKVYVIIRRNLRFDAPSVRINRRDSNVVKLRQNIAKNGTLSCFINAWKCFPCHSERSEESLKHVLRVFAMPVFFVATAPRSLRSNLRVRVKENLY